MRTSAESAPMREPGYEGSEEFLEFLSAVKGEVERAAKELGADFRFEIAVPESVDGDAALAHSLSFFVTLGKDVFPTCTYCMYAHLDSHRLRAYAGRYESGKVMTIKELNSLDKLNGATEALRGWLREFLWLSLGEKPENA